MLAKSLFAIVLAAGTSSRFGATKQLAIYGGLPMVTRAVRSAEAVCGAKSMLVVGNEWQKVAEACKPMLSFMVQNPDYAAGIAGSLRAGVNSVAEQADGILLLLADQPLINDEHLRTLISAWQAKPDSIVASAYAGTTGPPVIFPRRDFAAIAALHGDRGAKALLLENAARLISIPCADGAIDIDQREDLDKLRR